MDKPQSPQPVDADQFRLGMRTLAAAVTLITSTGSGHRHGMTATAVCSVSAEPPTLLVCLNKATATHGAVAKSGAFCVNLLRAEDWIFLLLCLHVTLVCRWKKSYTPQR